jgi:hydrogenase maturation protease
MSLDAADQIARAVLYEGYLLYPYRPSAAKNRQRWTFGGLFPPDYCLAQGGAEADSIQAECLVTGSSATALEVRARFLHLLARDVHALAQPTADPAVAARAPARPVASLRASGQTFYTWQEAIEREVITPKRTLAALAGHPHGFDFSFPANRATEMAHNAGGQIVGRITREQKAIRGRLELEVEPLGRDAFRLRARVLNQTPLDADAGGLRRDEAALWSLASTHVLFAAFHGAFVSLLDPPDSLRQAAQGCRNRGVYPVLVGEAGARDLMLASPIILYDYPQVAPESPGDFFDGTEIDEMLTLRLLTLTDDEKREVQAADERGRDLLEHIEALPPEMLARLHGAVRSLAPQHGQSGGGDGG